MASANPHLALESLGPRHWIAIALAFVSAAVHLVLGLEFLPHWMGAAFLASTAGFLAGIALVLADVRRRTVSLLGISFTAGQLVPRYAFNRPAGLEAISGTETIDKVAQVGLLVSLVVLYRRGS